MDGRIHTKTLRLYLTVHKDWYYMGGHIVVGPLCHLRLYKFIIHFRNMENTSRKNEIYRIETLPCDIDQVTLPHMSRGYIRDLCNMFRKHY